MNDDDDSIIITLYNNILEKINYLRYFSHKKFKNSTKVRLSHYYILDSDCTNGILFSFEARQ